MIWLRRLFQISDQDNRSLENTDFFYRYFLKNLLVAHLRIEPGYRHIWGVRNLKCVCQVSFFNQFPQHKRATSD